MSWGLFLYEWGIFVSLVFSGWPKGPLIILSGAQGEPSRNRRCSEHVRPGQQWWRCPSTWAEPGTGRPVMKRVICCFAALHCKWGPHTPTHTPRAGLSLMAEERTSGFFLSRKGTEPYQYKKSFKRKDHPTVAILPNIQQTYTANTELLEGNTQTPLVFLFHHNPLLCSCWYFSQRLFSQPPYTWRSLGGVGAQFKGRI